VGRVFSLADVWYHQAIAVLWKRCWAEEGVEAKTALFADLWSYMSTRTVRGRTPTVEGHDVLSMSIAANAAHQMTGFCIQKLCINSGEGQYRL
jgi:hypothetical protein